MKKFGINAAVLMLSGVFCGCVYSIPRDPFLWDDDAPIVKAQRVDVLEAEAVVIQFLRARGAFSAPVGSCEGSAREFEVFTSETDEAYQVFVRHNPNLCDYAPDEDVPPPVLLGPDGGPMEYAVSKKDLRIISVRLRGDKAKVAEGKAADAGELQAVPPDAGATPEPDDGGVPADSLPLTSSLDGGFPDGGFPKDGEILPRSQLPDTYTSRWRELGQPFPVPDGGLPVPDGTSPNR